MSSDSSSSSSDDILNDMIIEVTHETINYSREEAQSSTLRTRKPALERDWLGAHERLMQDYFCENPLYDDEHFRRVVFLYGRRYLRMLTVADVPLLYEANQRIHGFPGMLGSLNCTDWEWATCPTAWKGQHHRGDHDCPTLILQAVASQDLWIWHAYFGMASANNDIAVLQSSNLLDDVIDGVAPDTSFYANDVEYKYGYYLTYGLYSEWATFVKTLSCPDDEKIIRQGYLKKSKMRNVMYTCIILHNMILDDSGRAFCGESYDENNQPTNPLLTYAEKEVIRAKIRDRNTHHNFRVDMTVHLLFYREQGGDDEDDE
ncbi:uncharacterized protein LOC110876895 [Helianthus annuus]|uniref:uncharacterized protein LOC110876895 n=1 Tax=Helianthus annuus TaxID=4232 RepID=UPI000B8FB1D5|nr:uncharacterized protein LOC110876895 [Helianthus annuus]